jgi:hypothetical protein
MPKGLSLTKKEYEVVLNYYNLPYKKSDNARNIKQKAEKVLADKLCRCIKKVSRKRRTKSENRSIPICKKSILLSKGLTDAGFKCKKSRSIKIRKISKSASSKSTRRMTKRKTSRPTKSSKK